MNSTVLNLNEFEWNHEAAATSANFGFLWFLPFYLLNPNCVWYLWSMQCNIDKLQVQVILCLCKGKNRIEGLQIPLCWPLHSQSDALCQTETCNIFFVAQIIYIIRNMQQKGPSRSFKLYSSSKISINFIDLPCWNW